ncbi:MAG: response regulator transcription factor [bacterium]
MQNKDNTQIESILSNQNVDLIILEIIKKNASELEMIKKVKITFPKIAIILIDGDRELMAEAFANGVNDAFRKPYKSSLIVERVNALLNR